MIITEQFKKYKSHIAILVVAIIVACCLVQCGNNSKTEGEYKQLKKQYEALQDGVKIYKQKRLHLEDSLKVEIKKRDSVNSFFAQKNKNIEEEIQRIKNRPIKIPKDVQGLTLYFNERYKTKDNKAIGNFVGLSEFTAYDASYELEEHDRLQEILPLKNEQLANKDTIILNQDKSLTDKDKMLDLRAGEIKLLEDLNDSGQENIKNLEKQTRQLKRKNTFNKILVPVALIGGGFLGYKLAK